MLHATDFTRNNHGWFFLFCSWSPAGAIRAGRNPAVYKFHGEIIHVDGNIC